MKKEIEDFQQVALLYDVLMRLAAIEKILISKGIIDSKDLNEEINSIATSMAKAVLKNAVPENELDNVIKGLMDKKQ